MPCSVLKPMETNALIGAWPMQCLLKRRTIRPHNERNNITERLNMKLPKTRTLRQLRWCRLLWFVAVNTVQPVFGRGCQNNPPSAATTVVVQQTPPSPQGSRSRFPGPITCGPGLWRGMAARDLFGATGSSNAARSAGRWAFYHGSGSRTVPGRRTVTRRRIGWRTSALALPVYLSTLCRIERAALKN